MFGAVVVVACGSRYYTPLNRRINSVALLVRHLRPPILPHYSCHALRLFHSSFVDNLTLIDDTMKVYWNPFVHDSRVCFYITICGLRYMFCWFGICFLLISFLNQPLIWSKGLFLWLYVVFATWWLMMLIELLDPCDRWSLSAILFIVCELACI